MARSPVYVGRAAAKELVAFCTRRDLTRFLLVADERTYRALGASIEAAMQAQGFDVVTAVLTGAEIIADERHILQVLLRADQHERTYLAVGSGTITDIARFTSHRARNAFISLPTAPSVDGFTSIGAPLVLGGLKQTVICHGPAAVFADLPTLASAPLPLIASGFGDMMGKLVSLADWKLGHVLWDEPYDEQIAQRARKSALDCARHAQEVGSASQRGVRTLIEALLESGFCMQEFGSSAPASGTEHHISHFWETKLLLEHRPAIFHGTKVGVGTVLASKWYDMVRGLSPEQVADRLTGARPPTPDEQSAAREGIAAVYGPLAEKILRIQSDFLDMSAPAFESLKDRIIRRWRDLQEIAEAVPASDQVVEWLRAAHAPTRADQIGLSDTDVALALEFGHYFRNRFTIGKLRSLFRSLFERSGNGNA